MLPCQNMGQVILGNMKVCPGLYLPEPVMGSTGCQVLSRNIYARQWSRGINNTDERIIQIWPLMKFSPLINKKKITFWTIMYQTVVFVQTFFLEIVTKLISCLYKIEDIVLLEYPLPRPQHILQDLYLPLNLTGSLSLPIIFILDFL